MKPISSVTTTAPSKAVTAIGTPHGGRGLATRENSERVAAWLAGKRPSDMDAAAVSRASSHGVTLRVKTSGHGVYDDRGNIVDFVTFATGCDVAGDADARAAALADLENFMTPPHPRQIEAWLAELSVIVARRADDDFGDELRVVAYASRLSRYPADVVRNVLLEQRHKFWPTWEELERRCEWMTSPRRQMIAALHRGPEPKAPERRPATPEERARIAALVDEMFPTQPPEMRAAAVDEVLRGNCMAGAPMAGFQRMDAVQ